MRPSQKALQTDPGFWSCADEGINHPVHPDTACALVDASFLLYQSLVTCEVKLETTHLIGDAQQIKVPPPNAVPRRSVAAVKL